MFRAAVNHRILISLRSTTARITTLPFITPTVSPSPSPFPSPLLSRFCSSSPSPDQSFTTQNPNFKNSDESQSANSSSSTKEASGRRHVSQYQEEQSRVLRASLPHVNRLGWGEASMMAGAREVGVSPSIVGSFPRRDAALVEYFMDECLEKLIDIVESNEELQNLIPSERIAKLLQTRLEMQAPYITKWPQALSIQAMPANVPTSFKQRAALVDEIWHAAGDESSDLDWYAKRTMLGGIYSTTEIYMLTDKSADFRDTWGFLNARIRDAFDLKKSFQEAQYLAETVGAGLGGSLQGFVKGLKL